MPESRVVFALDLPSVERALSMATLVREAVGIFKVGLELFVEAGPRAVTIVTEVSRPVFLDLKLHDIPETVERAVGRASALGVRMLTVVVGRPIRDAADPLAAARAIEREVDAALAARGRG